MQDYSLRYVVLMREKSAKMNHDEATIMYLQFCNTQLDDCNIQMFQIAIANQSMNHIPTKF